MIVINVWISCKAKLEAVSKITTMQFKWLSKYKQEEQLQKHGKEN